MLTDCATLEQCEERLRPAFEAVRLVGELPFSKADVDKLVELVDRWGQAGVGLRTLTRNFPRSWLCLLVGIGVYGYREGNFWTAVKERISWFDITDGARWGRSFLAVLKKLGLPTFEEIDKTRHYVTPILLHGLIPESCMAEYCACVVHPWVTRELHDATDAEEVRFEIETRRRWEQKRVHLEKEMGRLRSEWEAVRLQQDELEQLATIIGSETGAAAPLGRSGVLERSVETSRNLADRVLHARRALAELRARRRDLERQLDRLGGMIRFPTDLDRLMAEKDEKIRCLVSMDPPLAELERELAAAQSAQAERAAEVDRLAALLFSASVLASRDARETLGAYLAKVDLERVQALGQELARCREAWEEANRRAQAVQTEPAGRYSRVARWVAVLACLVVAGTWAPRWLPFAALPAAAGAYVVWTERRRLKYQAFKAGLEKSLLETEQALAVATDRFQAALAPLPLRPDVLRSPDLLHTLYTLKDAYDGYVVAAQARARLEQEYRARAEQVRALAQEVGLSSAGLPAGALLQDLARRYRESQEQLATAEQTRREWDAIANLLAQVRDRERQAEQALVRAGEELVQRQRDLATRLETITHQLDLKQREYEGLPNPLPSTLSEPVRRFLLYGGQAATEILAASVGVAHYLLAGKVVDLRGARLPPRLLDGLMRWYEEHRRRDGTAGEQERVLPKLHRPELVIAPDTQCMRVWFPGQTLHPVDTEEAGIHLELCSANGTLLDSRPLRLYRFSGDQLRSDPVWLEVHAPSEHYMLSLKNRSRTVASWSLPGITPGSDPPFLAFDREGRVLPVGEGGLRPSCEWLLVADPYVPRLPPGVALESGEWFGNWEGFGYYRVVLNSLEAVEFADPSGAVLRVPVLTGDALEPVLASPSPLPAITSGGIPVYPAPPVLRIPFSTADSPGTWRLSIYPEAGSIPERPLHFALTDVIRTVPEPHAGVLTVDLAGLFHGPVIGRFLIRLRGNGRDHRFHIALAPPLQVVFERALYGPVAIPEAGAENEGVRVGVQLAPGCDIAAQPPAEEAHRTGTAVTLIAPSDAQQLGAYLDVSVPGSAGVVVPVEIGVPRVRWRMEGIERYHDFQDRVGTVLLGEWRAASRLTLIVQVPPEYLGSFRLEVPELGMADRGRPRLGAIWFDLQPFSDALAAGPPRVRFHLVCCGGHADSHFLLFTVSRFMANLRAVPLTDSPWAVELQWDDGGGDVAELEVRLWSEADLSTPVRRFRVSRGQRAMQLDENTHELLPGKYRVELAEVDPWVAPVPPTCPGPNVVVVDVPQRSGEIELVMVEERATGERYGLKDQYIIRVEGPAEDGDPFTWRGRLMVFSRHASAPIPGREIAVELTYSPDSGAITSLIEQASLEPLQYCPWCRRLWWTDEDLAEETKIHKLSTHNRGRLFAPSRFFIRR